MAVARTAVGHLWVQLAGVASEDSGPVFSRQRYRPETSANRIRADVRFGCVFVSAGLRPKRNVGTDSPAYFQIISGHIDDGVTKQNGGNDHTQSAWAVAWAWAAAWAWALVALWRTTGSLATVKPGQLEVWKMMSGVAKGGLQVDLGAEKYPTIATWHSISKAVRKNLVHWSCLAHSFELQWLCVCVP